MKSASNRGAVCGDDAPAEELRFVHAADLDLDYQCGKEREKELDLPRLGENIVSTLRVRFEVSEEKKKDEADQETQ